MGAKTAVSRLQSVERAAELSERLDSRAWPAPTRYYLVYSPPE